MKLIPLLIIVVSLIICAQQARGLQAKVEDQCCQEDWDNTTGRVLKAFTENGNNPSNPAFLTALQQWKDSLPEVHDKEEPEGTCLGDLYFKCENSKCICNNVVGLLPSVFQDKVDDSQTCRGGANSICFLEYSSTNFKKYDGLMDCMYGFKCLEWKEVTGFKRCESDPDATTVLVQELDANGNPIKGDACSMSRIPVLASLTFGILHSFGI